MHLLEFPVFIINGEWSTVCCPTFVYSRCPDHQGQDFISAFSISSCTRCKSLRLFFAKEWQAFICTVL